ncbi:hypothetical protein QR680_000665 [Steinernema hermaphroditum]|uniref:Nucleoporin NUP42 n=1 Tax=Steinernema hermaphroditum TaxID=289476 RepID=A0AA39GVD6_9BILA|nr:hypothetical protein QR680_000665 [Steinernema hermaphroditum]
MAAANDSASAAGAAFALPVVRPEPTQPHDAALPSAEAEQKNRRRNNRGRTAANRDAKKPPSAVCRYFFAGKCEYGENCKYSHESQTTRNGAAVAERTSIDLTTATTLIRQKRHKNKLSATCRFFLSAKCWKGEHCRFFHDTSNPANIEVAAVPEHTTPEDVTLLDTNGVQEVPTQPQAPQIIIPPKPTTSRAAVRPKKPACSLADKGTTMHLQIRSSDIHYFRRRYASSRIVEVDTGTEVTFPYEVTHPDWVFDVRELHFKLLIFKDHPYVDPKIIVVRTAFLPEVLCAHMDVEINELITKRISMFAAEDRFENMTKWLIHAIDRHIFNLFVTGLKKTKLVKEAESCGIKVVQLSSVEQETEIKDDEPIKPDLQPFNHDDGDDEVEKENVAAGSNIIHANASESDEENRDSPSAIRMRLQWTDNTGNIGTLKALSIMLAIKCLKCPGQQYLECKDGAKRQNRCTQCKVGQSVLFQSELVHQHSDLLGYLHFMGCRPLDFVIMDSRFRASCLNCNREVDVCNLTSAVVNKSWCHDCHTKCEFAIFGAKFNGNFALISREDKSVPRAPKKKKAELGPCIVVGQPLPENGTCKHYKKSYRWLRFPCCGKTFPCDVCHEEAGMGHEMKFATRMICGSCSHEQPFSKDKPCTNCKETTTKSKSSHWEGGRGCREKLVMSRNDDRKYKNSALKTVPKKRTGIQSVRHSVFIVLSVKSSFDVYFRQNDSG